MSPDPITEVVAARARHGAARRRRVIAEGPPTDARRVLVAYASRHGSTRGVAERMAARLRERGCRAEARPVDDRDDLCAYDAVVLGSAVYDQEWLPEADIFVRDNATMLAGRPVWLFTVGSFGDRNRLWGRVVKKEPRGIAALQNAIHARDYRVFAGVVERERWPRWSRLFFRGFGGRFGDNRDWPDIDAWADDIARTLTTRTGASR